MGTNHWAQHNVRSCVSLLIKWAHINFNAKFEINLVHLFSFFRYAGTSLGTVMSMLLAGLLAGSYGWESVFYVMGIASALWIILWMWLIQDTPSKQPLISQEERNYINTSLGSSDKPEHDSSKSPVPWRRVFTSLPFLAILVAHTCSVNLFLFLKATENNWNSSIDP